MKHKIKNKKGVEAVETALALLVLVPVFYAILNIGQIVNNKIALNHAVEAAARSIAITNSRAYAEGQIATFVRNNIKKNGINISDNDIEVTLDAPSEWKNGETFKIKVKVKYPTNLGNYKMTITSSETMVIEGNGIREGF